MKRPGSGNVIAIGCLAMAVVVGLGGALLLYGFYKNNDIAKPTGTSISGVCSTIPNPFKEIFTNAGQKYDVQPAMIGAIFVGEHQSIKETGYKDWPSPSGPWSTSGPGAAGPFQFMPGTWSDYKQDGDKDGKVDIQNLTDSSFAAAQYLSKLGVGSNISDDDKIMEAASRYNSGRSWTKKDRKGQTGQDFSETRKYVSELVLPAFHKFYCTPTTSGGPIAAGKGSDGVPLFLQCDSKWGDKTYGIPGHTICSSGCCPTAAAMVLQFSGINVDPVIVANFSYSHNFYKGNGTNHAGLIPALKKEYGLAHGESMSLSEEGWQKSLKLLQEGHPLIAAGKGKAPYSKGGHCIVLTGYDPKTDTVRVNNPSARLGNGPFPLGVIKQAHAVYYLGK